MNETLQTIMNLHSTHGNFSDRDVSTEDLSTILQAAIQAASASNMQSYSMIVVEDRKIIRERFEYAGSKAILFCADMSRLYEAAKVLGHPYQINGLIDFVMSSTDAVLVTQTAVIAARSLGIDSLITNSVHRHPHEETYQAFKLPHQYCFPILTLILGYENDNRSEKRGRLLTEGVIHQGTYKEHTRENLEHMITVYDDPERKLPMHSEWIQQGYPHYLDWLFTKWCGPWPESHKTAYRETVQRAFGIQD